MFKVRKLKKDIWSNSSEVKEQELCAEQVQLRGARKINKGKSERTPAYDKPYSVTVLSSFSGTLIIEKLRSLRDLVQETGYHVLLKISTATRNKTVMMRRWRRRWKPSRN